jgi:hypothetical protein
MTVKAAQFLRDRLNQKPKHILNDMPHNREDEPFSPEILPNFVGNRPVINYSHDDLPEIIRRMAKPARLPSNCMDLNDLIRDLRNKNEEHERQEKEWADKLNQFINENGFQLPEGARAVVRLNKDGK